jgi:hypothetical protein
MYPCEIVRSLQADGLFMKDMGWVKGPPQKQVHIHACICGQGRRRYRRLRWVEESFEVGGLRVDAPVAVATRNMGSYLPGAFYQHQKAPVVQRYKLLGRNPRPSTTGVCRFDSGASSPLPLQLGAEGFAAPEKESIFFGDCNIQPTRKQNK